MNEAHQQTLVGGGTELFFTWKRNVLIRRRKRVKQTKSINRVRRTSIRTAKSQGERLEPLSRRGLVLTLVSLTLFK